MKKRFNLLDWSILLVVVLAAAFVGYRQLFQGESAGKRVRVEFKVEAQAREESLDKAVIDKSKVNITAKGSDYATVTRVEARPARSVQFNHETGQYVWSEEATRKDVIITLEADAVETDDEIKVGSTNILVGDSMPLNGPGCAVYGYVLESRIIGEVRK